MTDEQLSQLTAGLNEERRGYVTRLAAAEESGDTTKAAELRERLAQVDRQLKAATPAKAKAPAKAKGEVTP